MTDTQKEIFIRLKRSKTQIERKKIGVELISTILEDNRPHFFNKSLNDSVGENWVNIPKYEGLYQASCFGRIKTFYRVSKLPKMILSGKIDNEGYFMVSLCKDGVSKRIRVHSIMRESFRLDGDGSDVNHLNGIKIDNRVCNIEKSTRKDNIRHAFDTGLNKGAINTLGTQRYNSVLNESLVFDIRTLIKKGIKRSEVCKQLNIPIWAYKSILRGAWKHVKV